MNLHELTLGGLAALILDHDIARWGLALALAVVTYTVVWLALRFTLRRLGRLAAHSRTAVDDGLVEVLRGTRRWLIAFAALLVGLNALDLPEVWRTRIGHLWFIALALQFGIWGSRAVRLALGRYLRQHDPAGVLQHSASATLASWAAHTVLWSVALLAILSNLGIDITAFVASLGVGGIAVALAVQNVLGDLFASLSIAVDKPFEVGDFIVFGDVSGTVEQVGLKTTRIKALSGEQVVVANTDLLKQTVHNYKRLQQRRIQFGFGITYDATPEQVEQVPAVVARIVRGRETLRFDRAHFKGFGESSLDFEVVYVVLDADYNVYMDEQQAINLALMRELAALGVEFAFPTRTVIVSRPEEATMVAQRPPVSRAH
ncbi:mechanosensitive ion channel [Aquabacterium sp. J223]|nr:mechanosensitive ion channel family protein [Aquabacterium sp. J223]UUX94111.1 mechanosensitive ion channel [Aquabacterium sp. J223]